MLGMSHSIQQCNNISKLIFHVNTLHLSAIANSFLKITFLCVVLNVDDSVATTVCVTGHGNVDSHPAVNAFACVYSYQCTVTTSCHICSYPQPLCQYIMLCI